MIEEQIDIATADGTADSVFYRPDEGRLPGVIHLTDIGGIRQAHRNMARRLADQGYAVLIPNVFYRSGRPPVLDYPMTIGDERTMKRLAELRDPLTPEAMARDLSRCIDVLTVQPGVADGPVAIVGYCFTGAMALRGAAERPDRVAAAASFHGGGLFTNTPASPHLLLPCVTARLYFGHAVEDRGMPADAIAQFDRALAAWGGRYASEVYDGAHHSWTVTDSPAYNRPQAERAFERLTALLADTLH